MNNIREIIEKEFNYWVDEQDELWEAGDVKDFAEQITKEAIEIVLGICRMLVLLNGRNSEGNMVNSKIREEVMKYFDITERDVNEIFNTNVKFREHLNLPRKGDPTYHEF